VERGLGFRRQVPVRLSKPPWNDTDAKAGRGEEFGVNAYSQSFEAKANCLVTRSVWSSLEDLTTSLEMVETERCWREHLAVCQR